MYIYIDTYIYIYTGVAVSVAGRHARDDAELCVQPGHVSPPTLPAQLGCSCQLPLRLHQAGVRGSV